MIASFAPLIAIPDRPPAKKADKSSCPAIDTTLASAWELLNPWARHLSKASIILLWLPFASVSTMRSRILLATSSEPSAAKLFARRANTLPPAPRIPSKPSFSAIYSTAPYNAPTPSARSSEKPFSFISVTVCVAICDDMISEVAFLVMFFTFLSVAPLVSPPAKPTPRLLPTSIAATESAIDIPVL